MAINKVIDRNGNTVIDLSTDTVDENKVLEGARFHGNDGEVHLGKLKLADIEEEKPKTIKFIDKYANLVAEYTLEELMALEELPEYDENLIEEETLGFSKWNWTLEELKSLDWEHTYEYPVVGALILRQFENDNLYFENNVNPGNSGQQGMQFYFSYYTNESSYNTFRPRFTIDWGDGTVETVPRTDNWTYHDYLEKDKKYTVKITPDAEEVEYIRGKVKGYTHSRGSMFWIETSWTNTSSVGTVPYDEYIFSDGVVCRGYSMASFSNDEVFIQYSKTNSVQVTSNFYKYISMPNEISYFYYNYSNYCPGCGFIPKITKTTSSSYGSPVINLYDDNIYYYDIRNHGEARIFIGDLDNKTLLNTKEIRKPKKIFINLTGATSSYSYIDYVVACGSNGLSFTDFSNLEEITVLGNWRYMTGSAPTLGQDHFGLVNLRRLTLSSPKDNKLACPIFAGSSSSGETYTWLTYSPLTVDLTRWKSIAAYNGNVVLDPIFGRLEANITKIPEGTKVLVRESLLSTFKTEKPWNFLADLYVGVPDEECEE